LTPSGFERAQRLQALKRRLREASPPVLWSAGSRLTRALARGASAAFATVVGTFVRALPARFAVALRSRLELERWLDYDRATIKLRVTSRSELEVRLKSCEKEPETVAWLEKTLTPESVVYDIGANVGAYALVAAAICGGRTTVYAFEPGSETYASLVRNIDANGLAASVTAFPVAIGAKTGVTRFSYSSIEAGAARHAGIMESGSAGNLANPVLCYQLDDFVRSFKLKPPTHMKVDVDGAELEVLTGAAETLESPGLRWVLIEADFGGHATSALRSALETHGFRLEGDHPHRGSGVHNWLFARMAE